MRDSNRTGGVSALVQAIFFLLIPVGFLLVLPRTGLALADLSNPEKLLAFSTKNALLMWFDAAMIIAAAAIVVLALVLQDRLRDAAPFAMRYAVIAASIGAALMVASGVVDIYDLSALSAVYKAGGAMETMATAAYAGVGTLAVGLFWAGLLAYGVSVLVTSWVALQARVFAPALNYVGLAWGVLAILSVFAYLSPTLFTAALIVPLVGLVWAGWHAWRMLGAGAGVRTQTRARTHQAATPPA
ncbi:MAG TPA: hypothetical protein VF120_15900 [Ktedonobacterales bacterium]